MIYNPSIYNIIIWYIIIKAGNYLFNAFIASTIYIDNSNDNFVPAAYNLSAAEWLLMERALLVRHIFMERFSIQHIFVRYLVIELRKKVL